MKNDSLTSQCETHLKLAIMNGELAPGSRLNNSKLAEKYNVAISPIREALSRLTNTKLVKFIDKCGFFVSPIDKKTFLDIANTYADIESLALSKAIEHGDEAWEMNIAAALYALSKYETNKKHPFQIWNTHNRTFHRALVIGCPSPLLVELRDNLYDQHERYIQLSFQYANLKTIQANHEEHKFLAETILARKKEKAIKLLRHHILSGKDEIIKRLGIE